MEENNGKLVPQASKAPELVLFNDVCGIIDNVRGEIALYANTRICLTKSLQHCVRAAYTFTRDEIVYATRTQLTWSHLRSLMSVKDPLGRQCRMEYLIQKGSNKQ